MQYKTAKRLALLWLKLKILLLLGVGVGFVAVGIYYLTDWGVAASIVLSVLINAVGFWTEDHPTTHDDRTILKFPFNGLTGSRQPTRRG